MKLRTDPGARCAVRVEVWVRRNGWARWHRVEAAAVSMKTEQLVVDQLGTGAGPTITLGQSVKLSTSCGDAWESPFAMERWKPSGILSRFRRRPPRRERCPGCEEARDGLR